ncbi:deoxyribonucleoside regulator [Bifidobacterium bohemicum]|uniref:DeoR family transcriptional regulator n=1 Tax=Bifidobacterium bohemicum DSM 22767 TaxID=1437606 RepID=A0A086ZJU0_9BIFI|nr:sugar-binding transcriptional regulator [Bifidobacterium bohemicum]KFI46790.1 DeoR family transcriptional regulator [Bifidobacterium bohemicum DSM 22767]SCB81526.1 deoxyribonucleoside regulator [Bifidobacterium bohemicum]
MSVRYEEKKLKQSIAAARLYYEDGLGQTEIAHSLKVSRPTVSRLLKMARETGVLKIKIDDPLLDAGDLNEQLVEKYHRDIHVVPNNYDGEISTMDSLGAFTAQYLMQMVRRGDVIGLGWGRTIHAVTTHLNRHPVDDTTVVQLKGGVNIRYQETYADESVTELASALGATPHFLPLPPFFDSKVTKEIVEHDRFIRQTLELGKKANIALYSVGTVRSDALLFQLGYFNAKQKASLKQTAVGDVVSRFIDNDGKIVNKELDDRTVGIGPGDLKKKEHSIVVASGLLKAPVIQAVMRAGYANEFIIDQTIAQELLTYED